MCSGEYVRCFMYIFFIHADLSESIRFHLNTFHILSLDRNQIRHSIINNIKHLSLSQSKCSARNFSVPKPSGSSRGRLWSARDIFFSLYIRYWWASVVYDFLCNHIKRKWWSNKLVFELRDNVFRMVRTIFLIVTEYIYFFLCSTRKRFF